MRTCLLLVLACLGCTGAPRTASAPTECAGQLTFIVSNRSNRDVDVLANTGSGGAQAIGTVRAGGNEELILPRGAVSAYTQFAREGSTTSPRGRVDTRYSCRP